MRVTSPLLNARTNWTVSQCSGTILDIGANQGHTFRDTGLNVTLLDINEFGPCEFPQIVADAHALPFKDSSFDYCVLTEILEHVHNPILVLREAARVCKKKVIFSVPDEYHWPKEYQPFQNLDSRLREKGMTPENVFKEGNPTLTKLRDLRQLYHNRWYTREMLEAQLKYVGLLYKIQVVTNKGYAYPGFQWFCGVIVKENGIA